MEADTYRDGWTSVGLMALNRRQPVPRLGPIAILSDVVSEERRQPRQLAAKSTRHVPKYPLPWNPDSFWHLGKFNNETPWYMSKLMCPRICDGGIVPSENFRKVLDYILEKIRLRLD